MGMFDGLPTVLRQLRRTADLNQDVAAERIGVNRKSIVSWEKGRTQPDLETLGKILDLYQISLTDLDSMLSGRSNKTEEFDRVFDTMLIEMIRRVQERRPLEDFLKDHGLSKDNS